MLCVLIGWKLFSFEKRGLQMDWTVSKCKLYIVEATVHFDLTRQTCSFSRGENDWVDLYKFDPARRLTFHA